MKIIKELDCLRALAILGVILTHWAPGTLSRIPWGQIGVHFFFVLSGFLITKILLESRFKIEASNFSKLSLIKNFYFRRALRIFPIYYLTIIILFFFRKFTDIDFNSALIYCITYTTNFYFFKLGDWQGQISHLWSLAVEEQFYLIWPWFIILINKKYLLHLILCFIAFGIVSEYLFDQIPMGLLLPNTCFDGFGLGALLAWVLLLKKDLTLRFYWTVSMVGVFALILFIFLILNPTNSINIPKRFLTFLISLWILTYVVIKSEAGTLKLNFIFNNPILLFLGKISYGMYLYHFMIPSLLNTNLINKYINPHLPYFLFVKNFKWIFFFENFSMLLIISSLSYYYIERKFLVLKKYYPS